MIVCQVRCPDFNNEEWRSIKTYDEATAAEKHAARVWDECPDFEADGADSLTVETRPVGDGPVAVWQVNVEYHPSFSANPKT